MKKGDKVKVYYDPLTEQEFEGDAKLVEEVERWENSWEGRTLTRWKIKFRGETKTYVRNILET